MRYVTWAVPVWALLSWLSFDVRSHNNLHVLAELIDHVLLVLLIIWKIAKHAVGASLRFAKSQAA